MPLRVGDVVFGTLPAGEGANQYQRSHPALVLAVRDQYVLVAVGTSSSAMPAGELDVVVSPDDVGGDRARWWTAGLRKRTRFLGAKRHVVAAGAVKRVGSLSAVQVWAAGVNRLASTAPAGW